MKEFNILFTYDSTPSAGDLRRTSIYSETPLNWTPTI